LCIPYASINNNVQLPRVMYNFRTGQLFTRIGTCCRTPAERLNRLKLFQDEIAILDSGRSPTNVLLLLKQFIFFIRPAIKFSRSATVLNAHRRFGDKSVTNDCKFRLGKCFFLFFQIPNNFRVERMWKTVNRGVIGSCDFHCLFKYQLKTQMFRYG